MLCSNHRRTRSFHLKITGWSSRERRNRDWLLAMEVFRRLRVSPGWRVARLAVVWPNPGEGGTGGRPAISVDTKKKELGGDFKNAGRELRPKGQPEPVRVHDFKIPELGRAVPYGVYHTAGNTGWVSVGIDRTEHRVRDGLRELPGRHEGQR